MGEDKENKEMESVSFVLNDIDIDVCKAMGHREAKMTFKTAAECEEFIKKVNEGNAEAIEELENNSELILDDWGVNDLCAWGDWEIV